MKAFAERPLTWNPAKGEEPTYPEIPECWHPTHTERPKYLVTETCGNLISLPASLAHAILRARENHLKAEKANDYTFLVRSLSKALCVKHVVSVKWDGVTVHDCNLCPGFARHHVCQHAGAVTARLLTEKCGKKALDIAIAEALEREQQNEIRQQRDIQAVPDSGWNHASPFRRGGVPT